MAEQSGGLDSIMQIYTALTYQINANNATVYNGID
jgi:hypothetical protein